MSGQKHQDLSEVFLKNERQQKLLDIQFLALEKLWLSQLRHINREKLDATADLIRLLDERKHLKYFHDTMKIDEIRKFSDKEMKRVKKISSEASHNKYDFDHQPRRQSHSHILPVAGRAMTLEKKGFITKCGEKNGRLSHNQPTKNVGFQSSSRTAGAKLYKSRLMSMSDSNLLRLDQVKPSTPGGVTSSEVIESVRNQLVRGTTAPEIVLNTGDDSQYSKHRMVIDCALPTVQEVANKRKLSF